MIFNKRNIALGLTLSVLVGSSVWAEDIVKSESGLDATSILIDGPISNEEKQSLEEKFIIDSGKVTEISKSEDGSVTLTIANEMGGLRFVVSEATLLVDRKDGVTTADKLVKGMQVSVVYNQNTPLGMSLPAYVGKTDLVVLNSDKGSTEYGVFNEDLINKDNSLKLNISEKTSILKTSGTREVLTAESLKNQNLVVFYDTSTRSIPAQTTPSLVVILNDLNERPAVQPPDIEECDDLTLPKLVPLRPLAVEKGYSVKWQGNGKPIILEKDGEKIEIVVPSNSNVAALSSLETRIIDGVTYVSSDILK